MCRTFRSVVIRIEYFLMYQTDQLFTNFEKYETNYAGFNQRETK